MPKKIDHGVRRLELAEALWRIVRSDGWEAISLRKVAAEAGVSMGMVQHYFSTKDEMLRFALEIMSEDVRARIRLRIAELPEPHAAALVVRRRHRAQRLSRGTDPRRPGGRGCRRARGRRPRRRWPPRPPRRPHPQDPHR